MAPLSSTLAWKIPWTEELSYNLHVPTAGSPNSAGRLSSLHQTGCVCWWPEWEEATSRDVALGGEMSLFPFDPSSHSKK